MESDDETNREFGPARNSCIGSHNDSDTAIGSVYGRDHVPAPIRIRELETATTPIGLTVFADDVDDAGGVWEVGKTVDLRRVR